ncbi:hypothetical protein D9615_009666 [Tricholomella constricta]|uniref:Uncharacterized protein n=1 Tax=Tricholomella constricta TaxID=117010 RepID=A0A8H5GUD0_9AGAR|nr:hypothetical protein D9615_009666 [Tricholomella constricta]
MNHPIDLLALDWANPMVRKYLHVYPEISSTVSEMWHADKWLKEVDLDDLSPMWANWEQAPHRHFYIKELAQLRNGDYVIPMRWVIVEGKEHAEVHRVHYSSNTDVFTIVAGSEAASVRNEYELIPATELHWNFLDLEATGRSFNFAGIIPSWASCMPHPTRQLAKGRPAFMLRIMPWCDDVSGNRSKQFNPHTNIYTANANLPHQKHSQEYFVRFCSTSPHASSLEQFEALAEDFRKWKPAYDCLLEQEILFQIHPHVLPADNPQQAESSSCAGLGSNFNCRYDKTGGSKDEKETDEGYDSLFKPGPSRTPRETIMIIKEQIWTACLGVQETVDAIQTRTGVKDKIAQHWMEKLVTMARERRNTHVDNIATRDPRLNDRSLVGEAREALKMQLKHEIQSELYSWVLTQPVERADLRPGDHFNVLLQVHGLDPHQDSPCELLHTFLLGEDKYIWHDTNTKWNKKKDEIFATRLQSSSIDGLSLPPLRSRYLLQYKNSLIGRHFKALQQLTVFHLDDDLCNPDLFNLWKASGELGALLWYPEIRNVTQYIADVEILTNNVLDLWSVFDPARIITKFKLHVLPHILNDIQRFGPAIIFSTEVFECWNAVFRLCSVLSNHLAPSHDIATTAGDMERFKHQVSGGWWKAEDNWVQGGRSVRDFLKHNRPLQRRLGWTDGNKVKPGTVKLLAKKHQLPSDFESAIREPFNSGGIDTGTIDSDRLQGKALLSCKYVISRSGDVCRSGSWVFVKSSMSQIVLAGRISKILLPSDQDPLTSPNGAVIVVEHFNVDTEKHARLDMPLLTRAGNVLLVPPHDVLFIFNAQHDCLAQQCKTVEEPVRQERHTTACRQPVVTHANDDHYIINTHALHNAHLIRETLPRSLTEPKTLFADRRGLHDRMAAGLRITGPAKRAKAKEKAKETRARKKDEAAQRRMTVQDDLEGLADNEAI